MPDHDDEHLHLTALARQGDKSAIARLFQQYRPKLRSMVSFRMDDNLRGRVDPSDVIQESFLDLAKRADEFKLKEMSPLVWMRLVTLERLLAVRRQHIDIQKRDARRELSIDCDIGFGATSMALAAGLLDKLSTASGKVVRAEQKAKLHQLLDEMNENDREIIALRIFEGLTNGEAAEVLQLTKQTTSKRFVRAIDRLRTSMSDIPGLSELFGNG